MKTVGQGTPECPWGCRTPLPPKSEWRISFHLQGTISILRAQNRKLVAAYEDPEQPGLPTNTSTTPAGAGGGAEDDRQQLQKDAPPLLRQRVDALHEEVNPDGHRQNLMILILGQSGVGKSLIHQFCINPNIQKPDIVGPTHGMDMKAVQPFSKLPLRFEVFDTAGQERFRGISLGNVRRAMGIVWVLDLSQEEDIFEQDEEFLRQCLQTVRPGVPFLFLANKIDIFRKKYAKVNKKEVTENFLLWSSCCRPLCIVLFVCCCFFILVFPFCSFFLPFFRSVFQPFLYSLHILLMLSSSHPCRCLSPDFYVSFSTSSWSCLFLPSHFLRTRKLRSVSESRRTVSCNWLCQN